MNTRILVCGATGKTGAAVLAQLRERGARPRALTRDARSVENLRAQDAEAVVGDVGDSRDLARVLAGIDAVYLALSNSPAQLGLETGLFAAAAAAGVQHVVKLSVIGAEPGAELGLARLHGESERALRSSGVGWTMVRATSFMQNALLWAGMLSSGTVAAPVVDARVPFVDARDVAAVAAAALLDPAGHAGTTYELTGPVPLSAREQVAEIAAVLGIGLVVQELSIAQAQERLRATDANEFRVQRLGELWRWYADGLGSEVHHGFAQVLGHPPRSFAEFVADHRGLFELSRGAPTRCPGAPRPPRRSG